MTSTPTPEPERQWVCHKPGWMGPCSPQSTHHNGFVWGCGWIYFPAPSTPGEGTGRPRPDTAKLRDAADWWTTWLEKPKHSSDHGWGDAIRAAADWIDAQPPASPADDVPDADAVAFQNGYQIGVRVGSEHHGPCRGLPPASPVPPTRPGADAVIRALIAACPSYGRGEGDTFRIEESAVVRLAREFLAAAPPTPTPCPYIVTGGEGTSYCSLAERSAMHAAAPPSTPAEQPEPDGGAA